ncbi:hypothetical protein ACFQ0R_00650 [Psychroflexus salinarum]|uniref:Uncharacterized protein n=1 Tax=Psychroflexus salinarum TaxID=546024 RepID=A0ABW3GKH7_9FLAO
MKHSFFLVIVVLLFSCASNTVIDSKTNKRVKVYENKDFQFYYPPNWEFYEFNKQDKLDGILRLAHKKTIYDAFTFRDSLSGVTNKVIGNKSNEKFYKAYQDQIIDSTESKYSSSSVRIIKFPKDSVNTKNKSSYYYLEKDFEDGNKEGVSRVSDQLYIIKTRINRRTRENDYRYSTRVSKKYVHVLEDFYYVVDYSASEFLYTKYLKDAEVVLKSFELK